MSTSITTQAQLASWLSSPSTVTATLQNAITINPATWSLSGTGLGIGYTLNGNNYNINVTPLTAGTTWPGLVNLQGGKIQSMGFTINTNGGTCSLASTGIGWLIGNTNSSGWVNTVLIYGCNVTTNNSGGFTGTGSRVYFNQCQFGVSGNNGVISGTYAGGIAGRYFSGTISKCLTWVTVSGDNSGGIVGGNPSYYSVTESRVNGSITGLNQGGIVGAESVGGFINNCYSLVSITSATSSGIMGSTSESTGGLGATTFNNVQNSYYLGTANANSGGLTTASSTYININNIASSQSLLSSTSTKTTTNISIQPYSKSSTFNTFNASTYASATDSSGNLYIGGAFTAFGGVTYNRLIKYTPSTNTFSTMVGNGITNGQVESLYYDSTNNRLYVGGSFTAPQTRVFYVDIATPGTAVAMGTGVAGTSVQVFTVLNNIVYVGGNFTSAGGAAGTAHLAKFSGGVWSSVGTSSLNNIVQGLSTYTTGGVSYLYIGGSFTSLGGVQMNRCAVYNINTNTWSPLGTAGTNNGVSANGTNVSTVLTVGSNIYYVGYFGNGTNGNGTVVGSPALIRWNTATSLWESTVGVYTLPAVMSDGIVVGGTKIYMFGGYQLLFNTVLSNNVWMFDTVTNQPTPVCQGFTTNSGNPPNRNCWDSVNNRIYYTMADGNGAQVSLNTQYITKYNVSNATFTGISPNTFNGPVYCMDYDPVNNVYYFGGSFTAVNGITCNRIVKWDGTTWSALGTGTDNGTGVYSMMYYNNNLYVGGDFTLVGGVSMIRFAVWNTTTSSTWSTLGQTSTGFNSTVQAISRFGSTIVAGGTFTNVNGTAVNYLVRYNGSAWVSMGSLTAGTWNTFKGVMQMKYYASKNLLYISGSFAQGNWFSN